MTDDIIDFEEDLTAGNLNKITNKAREMYALELDIKKRDIELKNIKEVHRFIQTEELPTIMAEEVSVDEIPFDNGYKLKLQPVISGNIPSQSAIQKCKDLEKQGELVDRRHCALNWLKDNGAGSIISNVLSIIVPKDESSQEKVRELIELANSLGLVSYQEETVHHATLNSYIKEQINDENGKDIPYDTFSVFVGKKAIIEAPKNK